jgi:UPF0755 protein
VSDSGERTAEEREAARREREARRPAREGRPAPPLGPAPPPNPAPLPSPAPRSTPAPETSPASASEDDGHDGYQAPGHPDRDAYESPEDDGHDEYEDHEDEVGWVGPEEEDQAVFEGPEEAPSGIRRVPGIATRGRPESRRSQSRSGVPKPRRESRPRGHSRAGRVAALLAIVLAAGMIWFLVQLFQPFHGSGQGDVVVTVPAHTSSSQVGDLLAREGVVSSGFFFELRATLGGKRGSLRPGTYHLQRDMSYGAALAVLTTPPPPVKVTNLTIIEGKSRSQINALLRAQAIAGSYIVATRHSPLLDPRRYGAPASTPSLEGFLFPSTYQLRDPVTAAALANDQLRTFRSRFATVNLGYASSRHLTAYDVLTVASIIEGEASTARDRALVASVIYNRLHDRMPLQMDSTTRFASGNYTNPLTASQLNSSSPYNTRLHKGLPPTPINNPGLAAIEAAAHPAHTNDLYFVVKPCGNGEMVFSSSYAQFLHDQALYRAARTRRGGRSPANC